MSIVWRTYWPSIRKHRLLLLASSIFLLCGITLDVAFPYPIRRMIAAFSETTPNMTAVDDAYWHLCIILIGLFVIWRGFWFTFSVFEARVMRDLDCRCFAILQAQPLSYFEETLSGSIVKQANRFRESFEGITDGIFIQSGKDTLLILFVLGIFFSENSTMGWLFLGWVVFFLGVSTWLTIWKARYDAAEAQSDSKVSGMLSDSLSNHTTVKAFAMEGMEEKRFLQSVDDNYRHRLTAWMMSTYIGSIQNVMMAVFQLVFFHFLIQGAKNGTIGVADFIFFQSYVLWICANLWSFTGTLRKMMQLVEEAKEMAMLFEKKIEIADEPNARTLTDLQGAISFSNVQFRYPTSRNGAAIDAFTLEIPPGQSVGIVGQSGAGKSTLARLLLRFCDPQAGEILLDGQRVRSCTLQSLRESISLVPQHPQLFHRTIGENIAFGFPGATKEQIIEAAKHARIWEFIQTLEKGLDEKVGERGAKLSGGEAQRIALARAFLANRRILILDEATSALDNATEQLVREAIADLLKGRTCIAIAHRLSTIMHMDRIIVIHHGRIVQDGTHGELIDQQGIYANLWQKSQQQEVYIR